MALMTSAFRSQQITSFPARAAVIPNAVPNIPLPIIPIFSELTYDYFVSHLGDEWHFTYNNIPIDIACHGQGDSIIYELNINGYNESNCLIVSQEHGFINSEIFAFWADHIFFPEVQKKRQQLGYDGIVILTLDGCSPHKSLYFEDECTKQNVYPFFEPPGTSDQVQALDLGIFGCQKRKHRRRKMLGLTKTDCVIVEIVDSWMKSTTPGSVVSAFNQAGIYIDSSDEKTIVRASANKARAVRGVEYTNGDNVVSGRKTYTIPSF